MSTFFGINIGGSLTNWQKKVKQEDCENKDNNKEDKQNQHVSRREMTKENRKEQEPDWNLIVRLLKVRFHSRTNIYYIPSAKQTTEQQN